MEDKMLTMDIKKYMDFDRGYTTIYDIGVHIIVFVFMSVLVREIFLMYDDERNKAYMIVCILVIGIVLFYTKIFKYKVF